MRSGWGALALAGLLALQGCAQAPLEQPPIDRSVTAVSQDSRVRFVVIHYTVSDSVRALSTLSHGDVSSHYLITDDDPPHVYQLVDENRRAWHAGVSEWTGFTNLNNSSIGIEIVNRGPIELADGTQSWQPYLPAQIETLEQLLRGIVARHGIKPGNIVGHSDIAPGRKEDPGPLFPWRQLARDGLGIWFDDGVARALAERFAAQGLPDAAWTQEQLTRVGYNAPRSGEYDDATRTVLRAFQMHFRPQRYDGEPDAETLGILAALAANLQ